MKMRMIIIPMPWTSLVVHCLRLLSSTAGGVGSIPDPGTKIPCAAQHSQKKNNNNNNASMIQMAPKIQTKCLCGLLRWLSGKESTYQYRRHRFNPWFGKILWRRKWQPIPVFLSGESHGQRSLGGYSPRDHKESDMTEHDTQMEGHI